MEDYLIFWLMMSQVICTALLTGVSWILQGTHYDAIVHNQVKAFINYFSMMRRKIIKVMVPLMAIEFLLAATIMLVPLPYLARMTHFTAFALLLLIWTNTFIRVLPLGKELAKSGYDKETVKNIQVHTWIRTAAWTLRLFLCVYLLALYISTIIFD